MMRPGSLTHEGVTINNVQLWSGDMRTTSPFGPVVLALGVTPRLTFLYDWCSVIPDKAKSVHVSTSSKASHSSG